MPDAASGVVDMQSVTQKAAQRRHLVSSKVLRRGRGGEEDFDGTRLHRDAAAGERGDGRSGMELDDGAAGEVVQRLEVEAVVRDDEDARLLDQRRDLSGPALEQHPLLELVCQAPVVKARCLRLLPRKLLDGSREALRGVRGGGRGGGRSAVMLLWEDRNAGASWRRVCR